MTERTEIKITLSENVDRAVNVLGLDEGDPLDVWFLEADGHRSLTPLLDAHIILRVRINRDTNDSTVKLRPCERTQLSGRWTKGFDIGAEDFEYKIEGDRAGSRHVLAASATAAFHARQLARAIHGDTDSSEAFTKSQQKFLEECSDTDVSLTNLVRLGPIKATRWTTKLRDLDHKVKAERWKVADLDFLELSIRVESDVDPEPVQQTFEQAVRSTGLVIQDVQQPKTQTVLLALAETANRTR